MPEVVSVVACGPSAIECGAKRAPGFVIAVNDAYRHVRHDAVLSMDGRWTENRLPGMLAEGPPIYLRRRAFEHIKPEHRVPTGVLQRVQVFDCDHTSDALSDAKLHFNGPNSGYCALNYAYSLRPRTVWLFGFDHRGGHFHPESEWRQRGEGSQNSPRKFADWSVSCYEARRYFDNIGAHVINTNRNSLVRAFEFGDLP